MKERILNVYTDASIKSYSLRGEEIQFVSVGWVNALKHQGINFHFDRPISTSMAELATIDIALSEILSDYYKGKYRTHDIDTIAIHTDSSTSITWLL